MKRSVFVSGEYNSIGISRVIEPYFLPMLVSSSTPGWFRNWAHRPTAAPLQARHYSPLFSITYSPFSFFENLSPLYLSIAEPAARRVIQRHGASPSVSDRPPIDPFPPSPRVAKFLSSGPRRDAEGRRVRKTHDRVRIEWNRSNTARTVLRVCASLGTGSLGYLPARFRARAHLSSRKSDLIRKRSLANDVPDLPPLAR